MDPATNLREDGWAHQRPTWSSQRNDLSEALIHTCGPLSKLEDFTGAVPRHNLLTTWNLTPDDPFPYKPLPRRLPGEFPRTVG